MDALKWRRKGSKWSRGRPAKQWSQNRFDVDPDPDQYQYERGRIRIRI